jgi:uncharacterized small protein (DUF1192 family)
VALRKDGVKTMTLRGRPFHDAKRHRNLSTSLRPAKLTPNMAHIWRNVGDVWYSISVKNLDQYGGFMGEREKRANFVRIAENRVSRAIKSIRVIGNLSNRSNYSYTDADVRAIISALQSEVTTLKAQFSSKKSSSTDQFKLQK